MGSDLSLLYPKNCLERAKLRDVEHQAGRSYTIAKFEACVFVENSQNFGLSLRLV